MREKLSVYNVKKVNKLKNLKENEISKLAHNFLDLENEQLTEAIFR